MVGWCYHNGVCKRYSPDVYYDAGNLFGLGLTGIILNRKYKNRRDENEA